MGVIHYRLRSSAPEAERARDAVDRLRQRALDLPFESVGEIVELSGNDCNFELVNREHPHLWLLIQAQSHVPDPLERLRHHGVIPLHVIAFSCWPGPGCAQANFGLARYPDAIHVAESEGCGLRRLETRLDHWSWASFCKTAHAGARQHGGMCNFRRCHSAILEVLRCAQSQGILQQVHDEAGYWDNLQAVAQILGFGGTGESSVRMPLAGT